MENKNLSKSITLPTNSYNIPPQATDNSEFTFPSDHRSSSSSSSSKDSNSLSSNEFLNSYDDFNSHSSDSTSTSSSSSSSDSSDENLQSDKHKKKHKKKSKSLSSNKVCNQALQMINFLGTLNMKKLDLKHEPRQRRAAFIDWISQLEIAFSSNKYTRKVLKDYTTKSKIHKSKSPLVEILIYTVAYAFLDKPTRISTIAYKNKGSELLKILHLKCASVDENTKIRARMAFMNCKISYEETAINFLTCLEQRAN